MTDITNFNNWQEFDISKIERGKEYVFYFPKGDFYHYRLGRIVDWGSAEDLEFDYSDFEIRYKEIVKFGEDLPTHYFEITVP